jgi:hypothetical protein
LRFLILFAALTFALVPAVKTLASEGEKPVSRDYTLVRAKAAPAVQTLADMEAKSAGCLSCHVRTDAPTMHATAAVQLGCTDCHGGDAVSKNAWGKPELGYDAAYNKAAMARAHVLPKYPESWHYPSSANPKRSYTLLNKEAPEFVRFVNPGDYRVARESCGGCHMPVIEAAERSLMASGAMLFGGAAYNNGIVPFKNYMFGEAYTTHGEPAKIVTPGAPPGTLSDAQKNRGALAALYPLPRWNVIPPGDVFRVFERGGRNVSSQFAEIGLPNPNGIIQRLEEPGRPDLKQSNRGPATGLRVAIPVLNIHKTRLNDPYTWFMGTNDQPGDYRHSGCTSCHVIYANDREPRHSLIYASLGRDGQTITVDPTIAGKMAKPGHDDEHGGGHAPKPSEHGALKTGHETEHGDDHGAEHPAAKPEPVKESGHPLQHVFTRAIPTAQCMNCHMHQPNIFLNSFLGYTMWDYESDAPKMWPEKQKYPTMAEMRAINDRNPEGAAPRGNWGDIDFLRNVYDVNETAKDTQFADYHGHGWNFRGIFKRDREGNLLDGQGNMATWGTDKAHIVDPNDPEKWRKAGATKFASIGRWQPPQLVVHDRWQVKQASSFSLCARSAGFTPGPKPNLPSSAPVALISLARAALALKCGEAGSTASLTRLTCQESRGSTIERWVSTRRPPASVLHSKRRWPSGLRSSARLVPLGGAAGPEVSSVGHSSAVPWQSLQPISTALATSP